MMSELVYLTACEMAEGIRKKQFSPVELVRAHVVRAEKLQPKLNAFAHLDGERAMEQARAAEAALIRGDELGPLHGVPVTMKSSIDMAGYRCECGTRLRSGNIAKKDAVAVERLKAAGAVMLGTTNAPELLMAYETDNALYGKTCNPWDLARTSGGSSGGESAAIAAGCSAAGVGSDGGGSIRVPAHFSGICGLKPTPGRIPSTGHFPPSDGPFSRLGVVGPMARSVGDLQLLLDVLAGPDDGDASSAPVGPRRVAENDLKNIRIGFFDDDGAGRATPETCAAVRAAAEGLASTGIAVEPFRPQGLEQIHGLWWTFFGLAGGMLLGPMIKGHESEISPTLRELMDVVSAEPPLTLERLMAAWVESDQCRRGFLEQMRKFPILLCPVCTVPAFRHGEGTWKNNGKGISYLETMRFSQWFNLTGNPAAVVPVGQSPEGLPIGVQVVGRPFEEELVLAVAGKIEEAGHGVRYPPLE
jgi:Asp-tRNA(Asn)/Glu-tRNA(Gln) amidotransferase A subunit family amidase